MPVTYQFLPWVRRGLATALTVTDHSSGQGAPLPSRGLAKVGVRLAGLPADAVPPLDLQLHGPGDVIGLEASLVVRTEPRANATNFEPNYFAAIDFDPPDLPWLLTPASADAQGRLRPWLVLVVCETSVTGLPRVRSPALLPVLRLKAADVDSQLPPLRESWSWAHTQVVSEATDVNGVRTDLQANSASNISRLLCPRKLEPNTSYVACVVPAFKPGVLRGLGLGGDGSGAAMQTLAPAWAAGEDAVLPVYFHWEFSTGDAGDFESLARRLKTPRSYQNDAALKARIALAGTAPMRVDDLINADQPGLRTTMEGALVPISYTPGKPTPIRGSAAPFCEDVQAPQLAGIVNTPLDQVVDPVGDGALNAAGKRLEVKPPLYGAWHAKDHSADPSERPTHWLAGLNLNPRYRAAAGHGAEVVRQNQEDYVDACWDQVGEVLASEMKFNLTRLAIEVQRALKTRHFDPLPPERLLQVMGPALPRIEALGADGVAWRLEGGMASLGGQLERTSLPSALAETGLRRLLSPQRGALRKAVRLNPRAAALSGLASRYLGIMAAATQKPDAFAVNRFVPDGILGTRLFDGVALEGDAERRLDLTHLGLGMQVTVGQLRRQLAADKAARAAFARHGATIPQVRPGQHRGIFTDLHSERFAAMATIAPTLQGSDWSVLVQQVEAQGARGVEGFLVESDRRTAALQFSAMRLDSRSGSLRLDRVLTRFDGQRHGRAAPASRAPPGSLLIGRIDRVDAAKFSNAGLLGALPLNALVSTAGSVMPSFELGSDFDIAGGAETRPAGPVASVTLPAAIRKRPILKRFTVATRGLQAQWVDAMATLQVIERPVDFDVPRAAAIVRVRTAPELTLGARLATLVSVGDKPFTAAASHVARFLGSAAPAGQLRYMLPALQDRVMAWPHLRVPLYEALAAVDREAFMPGIGNLPQNLIMLVQVNQKFIDAFMVGANVEMNRELLWRGFPTDLRGTPFQRFWGRFAVDPATRQRVLADDMEPIHAWGVQPLGERVDPNQTGANRVALLVRGQVLRRYPDSALYAWEREGQKLKKNADGSPTKRRDPAFAGVIAPDISFYGFDIRKEEIGSWCFVLEQPMTEVRFGFDVEETPDGQPALPGPRRNPQLRQALVDLSNPASELARRGFNPYRALSWSHIAIGTRAHLSVVDHLVTMANKPYDEFPTLAANASAADVAKALLQEPFRGYYIGTDLAT